MHDSEQEHSSITGCRVTYESTIFYNEANKFSIIVVKTSDPRIPPQACSGRYYGDRMLRFTAVGYGTVSGSRASTAISCKSSSGRKSFRRQRTVCWRIWVPGLSKASVPRQQRTLSLRSDRTP